MKIRRVRANNRKHAFEVDTAHETLLFPYSHAEPTPSRDDRIVEAYVDAELGREAFTYVLQSGDEGTIHVDAVLEYNDDPHFLADLALYKLTAQAKRLFEESELSARELAHLLDTSPAQLYRLLDPTNYTKSVRQLISLLYFLGYEVDLEVRERERARSAAG